MKARENLPSRHRDQAWSWELAALSFWLTVAGFVSWMRSFPPENKTRDYPIQRSAARDERSMILIGVDGTLLLEGATEPIKQAKKKKKDFRARLAKLVANSLSSMLGMRIQKLEELTSAYVAKHQRK